MANKRSNRYGDLGDSGEERANPWENVEPEYLTDFVRAVVRIGDAVMLSRTSDGGAARIMLFSGNDKERIYATDAADLNSRLRKITQHIAKTAD